MRKIDYQDIIFDCDGVVLNSNRIKTKAFAEISQKFGNKISKEFVDHHIRNGGVSRYEKIEFLISLVERRGLKEYQPKEKEKLRRTLLRDFSDFVYNELLICDISEGFFKLRDLFKTSNFYIVSGGEQGELQDVFNTRSLSEHFDGGIYGSPSNKFEIITHLKERDKLLGSVLYIGDSVLDFEVARHFQFDFIFVSNWTEFSNWEKFFKDKSILCLRSLESIYEFIR